MNQYKLDHYPVNVLVAIRHSGNNMRILVHPQAVEAQRVEEVRRKKDSKLDCMGLQELGHRVSIRVVVEEEEEEDSDNILESFR